MEHRGRSPRKERRKWAAGFWILWIILWGGVELRAQNLVPNGDFESHSHCPTHFYDLSCDNWRAYTSASPDYFHRCQQPAVVGIPQNFFGYQQSSGNAYAGFYSISIPGLYEYKEYLTTAIEPMQPGFEYQVLLKVSLADSSSRGTDDIGVLFYEQGPHYIPAFESYIPRRPQVEFSSYGPLTDKEKWYYLESRFIPDSVYRYLVIGGFKSYSTLPVIQQVDMPSGNLNGAYYYLDSVVVRLVHEGSLKILDTEYCAQDTFTFTFQVAGDFRPGNWFYLEMSDSAGRFDQPLILDSVQTRWDGVFEGRMPSGLPSSSQYRLRLRSSIPYSRFDPHPVPITYWGVPDFQIKANTPLCAGQTLILSPGDLDTLGGIRWTGPGGEHEGLTWTIPEAKPEHSGWYVLESLTCGYKDSVEVEVHPRPEIALERDHYIICPGDSLWVSVEEKGSGFEVYWKSGSVSGKGNPWPITLGNKDSLRFAVYAENPVGCRSDTLEFSVVQRSVTVGISPLPMMRLGDTSFFQAEVAPPEALRVWTGPDGFYSEQVAPRLPGMNKDREGWYYLRASLGQCAAMDSVYVLVSTASEARLYPNPAQTWVRVEGRLNQSGAFFYSLFDLRGRKLLEAPFLVEDHRFSFTLPLERLALAPGVYMLRLEVPGDGKLLRWVKLP